MRAPVANLIALALALCLVTPALGQTAPPHDELIRAKIAEVDAELAKLQMLRSELQALLGPEAKPVAPASPKAKPWNETISLDGYAQLRYIRPPDDNTAFSVRRLRLNVRATPSTRSKLRVELAGDNSELRVLQAWAEYALDDQWSARAGQFVLPFGYELVQGNDQILPLERSRTVSKPFADRWDNGVVLMRKAQGSTPQVDLWVINGQGRKATDADSRKNLGVRLNWRPQWGQVGASYQCGSYVDPTSKERTDRNALGVHAVYEVVPWMLSGEYVTGEALGHDIAGWYAQVARRLPNERDRLYARYERYDKDRKTTSDDFRALAVGLIRDLDTRNRVTLQFQDATDAGEGKDEWGMQWQVSY